MRPLLLAVAWTAVALICQLDHAEAADGSLQAAGVAYLRVSRDRGGGAAYENYCAYSDPRLAKNLSQNYLDSDAMPIADLYPSNGCAPSNASYTGRVALVARGGCSYSDKAANALAQGATGLIVVSPERYPPYIYLDASRPLPSNFPVSLVSSVAYKSFKSQFLASGGAVAGLYRPINEGGTAKQYMFLVLYAIALVTIVISCVAAATALRQHLLTQARLANGNLNGDSTAAINDPDSVGSANCWQTALFVGILIAVPITILVLLYFAYDYFVWVMLVLYGYSVATSLVYYANRMYLAAVQTRLEQGPRPWLASIYEINLGKCCGKISYTYFEFVATPFGLAVAAFWFAIRNAHWAFILTDLLNVVLVMRVIESLALVLRIKIATIVLVCFLVYDVFFVFITPLFSGSDGPSVQPTSASVTAAAVTGGVTLSRVRRDTVMDYYIDRGGSVMERVALGTAGMSGEIIPIVFKVMPYPPAESISTCLLPYSILGLGDVILPAILLSLNLFFDLAWSNRLWPYFTSSLIGYLAGLGACAGVLFATGKGQPALLYIVPLILIASYLCAAIRREVKRYFHTCLPDEYRIVPLSDDVDQHQPMQSDRLTSAPMSNHSKDPSGTVIVD